jgi:hypothetical protein
MPPIKIGFVLPSHSKDPLPSTRISALNMFPFLRQAGFDPSIAFEPPLERQTETPDLSALVPTIMARAYDIVFFQKVHGAAVEGMARTLKGGGIGTVYGVCDRVSHAMVDATDATVAVTQYLKDLYPAELQAKIHVVHDGIENPRVSKTSWDGDCGTSRRPLRAVLVTSSSLSRLPVIDSLPEWMELTIVGRYPSRRKPLWYAQELRTKLTDPNPGERMAYIALLANRRIRRVPWSLASVYDHMERADIGIIPIQPPPGARIDIPAENWMVKSENRLTMKMSIGLPVVATPIPAYEAVVEQGVNGFLARSRQDWLTALDALRDPQLRQAVGTRARHSVAERYSMQAQAQQLVCVLRELVDAR